MLNICRNYSYVQRARMATEVPIVSRYGERDISVQGRQISHRHQSQQVRQCSALGCLKDQIEDTGGWF